MFSDDLKKFCSTHSDVFLYGAGDYGKQAAISLLENKEVFDGFVVTSNPDKTHLLNKKVYQIDKLSVSNPSFVICINEKYHSDILNTIAKYFPEAEMLLMYEKDENELLSSNVEFMTDEPIRSVNKVNILLFHRVEDIENDKWKIAITPKHFDDVIAYIKSNYRIIRFTDDFMDINEPSVVITFDDGYEDNYLNAFPILKKYDVPAIIFVSSDNIDTDKEQWWDRLTHILFYNKNLPDSLCYLGKKYDLTDDYGKTKALYDIHQNLLYQPKEARDYSLKWLEKMLCFEDDNLCLGRSLTSSEIQEMDRSGLITIGGHTISHTSLASETIHQQYYEIYESKKKLENILGHRITTFSYPFGGLTNISLSVADNLQKTGFERCATLIPGLVDLTEDDMFLNRNVFEGDITADKFSRWFNKTWLV